MRSLYKCEKDELGVRPFLSFNLIRSTIDVLNCISTYLLTQWWNHLLPIQVMISAAVGICHKQVLEWLSYSEIKPSSKLFGYYLRVYCVLGKILNLIGQISLMLEIISLLLTAQY